MFSRAKEVTRVEQQNLYYKWLGRVAIVFGGFQRRLASSSYNDILSALQRNQERLIRETFAETLRDTSDRGELVIACGAITERSRTASLAKQGNRLRGEDGSVRRDSRCSGTRPRTPAAITSAKSRVSPAQGPGS